MNNAISGISRHTCMTAPECPRYQDFLILLEIKHSIWQRHKFNICSYFMQISLAVLVYEEIVDAL
jgi:hypothetical protein